MIGGLSFGILVGLAGMSACSSTSTNDNEKGGSGAVITAGSGGTGTGGTGGTGGASTAGTPSGGTAGSPVVGCPGMPVTCVDAMNAQACNPDTNMVETVNCKDEFATSGLISAGCTTDPAGSGCTIDGGADETCWNGAQGIAVCADLNDDQFLGAYVNCFNDVPEARMLLTCMADFVDVEAMTVDCDAAQPVCLPEGAGGAAPDGGGGAAPDGAGGAP
jgi:hypothetical protein